MPVKAFTKIDIKPEIIASLTFIFAANWGASALFVIFFCGFGKEFAHTALFWPLDYLFCPLVCAAWAGLLVYYYRRHERSPSPFKRATIIFGFIPIVAFLPLAHVFAWRSTDSLVFPLVLI